MKSLWYEFCDQNSSALAAVLVAVARSLAEVKEGRVVLFTVRALSHVQEQMLGSQLRPLSAVRKQRLAGTQLASFLATFRADLPPSLKLSLNWFFVLSI